MARVSPELVEADRYPFSFEMPTRYSDLDTNHHLNNVALAGMFEEGRARYIRSLYHGENWKKRSSLLASIGIEYLAQAFYPAPIQVHVGTLEIGRTSFTLASLLMQNGQCCAFARAAMVCFEDGGPAPLTDTLRAALEQGRLSELQAA